VQLAQYVHECQASFDERRPPAVCRTHHRTAYRGERFVLQRVAAVIPIEEYDILERMIGERENEIDARLARKARKEKGSIPLEAVKKKLGF
jgi:hypothetical protein